MGHFSTGLAAQRSGPGDSLHYATGLGQLRRQVPKLNPTANERRKRYSDGFNRESRRVRGCGALGYGTVLFHLIYYIAALVLVPGRRACRDA